MKDEIVKFGKDYVLFCHVTSRVPGAKHDNLLSEKGGQGFPHLVAMDSNGDVLAEHEGARDVPAFEKTMGKAREFVALRKKADAGDKGAKFKVLVHRMKMGSVPADEAEKAAKEIGPLSAEQEKELQGLLADAAVRDVLKEVKPDPASRLEAGKKFLEMKKAGKPAPTGESESQAYWILMMNYAESQKDTATFEEGLNALKAKFGQNPQAQKFFQTQEEKLKKLREK